MTEQQIRKWKMVYGIGISLITVLVGVLFIVQTWSIFFSAEKSPYTVEIIGEKLLQILLPICIWGVAFVGGVIINALFPEEKKTLKGYVPSRLALANLKARLPESDGGRYALNKEERFRIIVWCVCVFVCGVACVLSIVTLLSKEYTPWLQGSFFTAHGAVADRLLKICLYFLIAFLVCVTAIFLNEYSIKRETSVVKAKIVESIRSGKKMESKEPVEQKGKNLSIMQWKSKLFEKFPILKSVWWKKGLQIGLCLIGVLLCIIGIANGGMMDVFEKARNICTQCIGLG